MFEEIEPGKDVVKMVLGVSQCTRLHLREAHHQPLTCYPGSPLGPDRHPLGHQREKGPMLFPVLWHRFRFLDLEPLVSVPTPLQQESAAACLQGD